jgi:hypothetical protein
VLAESGVGRGRCHLDCHWLSGAWIVSGLLHRLFSRNQAITAMVLAERLAAGYGDDDLFVIGWREELGL